MIFKNNGFSLIELLVTISILGVLAGVAIPSYVKYKESAIGVSMRAELAELSKSLNYAHSVDGGYHHNIYTMGYRPNSNLVADTGFEYARGTAPECTRFPRNNTGDFSPFLTITANSFDASHIDSAVRASELCTGGHCSKSNKVVPGTLSQNTYTSGHAGCVAEFSQALKCDCDTFRIYSRAFVRSGKEGRMFANQDGVFGYSDKTDHIDLLK